MRGARTPVLIVVVALTLADAFTALALAPGRRTSAELDPRVLLAGEVLAFSQVSLMAVWLAWGRRPVAAPGRLLGTWLMIAFWSLLFRSTVPPGDGWRLMSTTLGIVFLAEAVVVAAPLLVARLRGFELGDDLPQPLAKAARPGAFQFTLGSLLLWTAVTAFCLGTAALVFDFDRLDQVSLGYLLPLVMLGGGHGLIALALVWAVLGTRWLPVRIVLVGLMIGALVLAHAKIPGILGFYGQAWGDWHRFLTPALLCAPVLLVSLGAVRTSGLRIVRRVRSTARSP